MNSKQSELKADCFVWPQNCALKSMLFYFWKYNKNIQCSKSVCLWLKAVLFSLCLDGLYSGLDLMLVFLHQSHPGGDLQRARPWMSLRWTVSHLAPKLECRVQCQHIARSIKELNGVSSLQRALNVSGKMVLWGRHSCSTYCSEKWFPFLSDSFHSISSTVLPTASAPPAFACWECHAAVPSCLPCSGPSVGSEPRVRLSSESTAGTLWNRMSSTEC